ncbi:MAG: outer membrane protein assembly factor BamD [Chthoniobacterales bacterium]
MSYRFRFLLLLAAACLAFPERSPAPVIFRPGEKVKYQAPGEEVISGNANELYAQAEAATREGKSSRAIKIYKKLVKKYPRSDKSPESTFRAAKLTEGEGKLIRAASIYRGLMETYPQTPHFQEAIESQFRIGEYFLNKSKRKILGVPLGSTLDDAVEIFAAIVRSAPYGRYTARAQFDIGRAREKEGSADLAIDAYQSVVEKFPNDPLAVDAQYQIGYIWLAATRAGTYDPAAAEHARTAFQDFLFRFPKSEKAAQAKENLVLLSHSQTKGSFEIAKYYDKAKNYRAAVLYYNDVIRQQPDSAESAAAKTRIEQLRSKVGDAALQSAAEIAERRAKANPKKTVAQSSDGTPAAREERPPTPPEMRGNPNDIAPLPPPADADSLPPPAAPDGSAAAPGGAFDPNISLSGPPAASEPSPTPEPSATP